jgi:hypothetical protein
MKVERDPFNVLLAEEVSNPFTELNRGSVVIPESGAPPVTGAVTARLHGFDLEDRPVLTGLPGLRQEVVAARSTTALSLSQIGATVVALCEDGDARKPIIMGVLERSGLVRDVMPDGAEPFPLVSVKADDDELVLSAERQIVLKCGDASITLTRAGKVLIKGNYLLSRSSGYNKIKGAAVDIN